MPQDAMIHNSKAIEKPMLFSRDPVRGILDGTKTQSRRIVKDQPVLVNGKWEWRPGKLLYSEWNVGWNPITLAFKDFLENGHAPHPIGSRIWVKETWQMWCHSFDSVGIEYPAGGDGKIITFSGNSRMPSLEDQLRKGKNGMNILRPSIHMPRWASRIDLEVTNVRLEWLNDISEEDAIAEGVTIKQDARIAAHVCGDTPARMEYWHLWESINGKGSWERNPLVFAYTFKRI